MRRTAPALATLALALVAATTAAAAPSAYVLEPAESRVGFETDFGPDRITGQMAVTRADLTLDFDNVAATRVAVTLDVTTAEASFPFAAQAMRGPRVLDAATWPEITFASTTVRRDGDGARVAGDLTIRGVTRPVNLDARIYRRQGTAEGDRSRLTIRLTGAVNRSDFGATGWSDMVGDQVRLDILARIRRVE
jgi:polyisoprenoid-binding protein YceI